MPSHATLHHAREIMRGERSEPKLSGPLLPTAPRDLCDSSGNDLSLKKSLYLSNKARLPCYVQSTRGNRTFLLAPSAEERTSVWPDNEIIFHAPILC